MGEAYGELVEHDRDTLLIQLHSQTAAPHEPLIRDAMQKASRALRLLSRESGAGAEEIQAWFAMGMLINVMAAIGAEQLDAEWAQVLANHEYEDC